MPTIPEETEADMDDFVNWDRAAPAVGTAFDMEGMAPAPAFNTEDDPDLGLVLENVDGDDFSFWALEHFEQSNLDASAAMAAVVDPNLMTMATSSSAADPADVIPLQWEMPPAPCGHCRAGGYQCKRIKEGTYKGYCTSCVALRCACDFGDAGAAAGPSQSATFPPNPWPTLGDHPNSIPHEDTAVVDLDLTHSVSASDLPALMATAAAGGGGEPSQTSPKPAPKIGARFSRESVKILKNWLQTHHRHPYPTEDEKESLQRLTGLNKTQITNWLANARRRGKIQPPRSTSPHVKSWTGAIDIPTRRSGTPSPMDRRSGTPFESMNPLQRWANSPPENEPADADDIVRAINSSASAISSGLNSPYSFNYTDDGSGRSCANVSSTSSLGTTHSSGGSFASAYSHASRGSFGSFGSMNRGRRRRRRRTAPKMTEREGPKGPTPLNAPLKTFQCTFCTETFRTKHDWQRHEKSLHLSLERWVCAPKGPTAIHPDTKVATCVFCGEANPDEEHIETHNFSSCQERVLSDRTFYRKDHLRQHLKLVHSVKFSGWSMDQWKAATPEIRSRCGFCGIVMDTWTFRVDHLAEHFKTGNTMADWKGDWGFDAPVLDMVENSIPPYLIHDERNSPLPFTADLSSPETPRNAYELVKWELAYWLGGQRDEGKTPSDKEIQLEACRIVFGAEVLSQQALSSTPSWLRDLLMSCDAVALQAQLQPIRSSAESRMARLRINGKDNIFEECPLERQLRDFVVAQNLLGLTAIDWELQVEACNIIGRMEESSAHPSEEVANFLVRSIHAAPHWLEGFRRRANLPRSADMVEETRRSRDPNTIDSTIHNYSRLESELAQFVRSQRAALGVDPDDASLQKQARIIIYEFDDGWNQTAADNEQWLAAFKTRNMAAGAGRSSGGGGSGSGSPMATDRPLLPVVRNHGDPTGSLKSAATTTTTTTTTSAETAAALAAFDALMGTTTTATSSFSPAQLPRPNFSSPTNTTADLSGGFGRNGNIIKTTPFFLNDANCYRRVEKELARWVAATMSPNNPNCHVPTDQELQHQARWILYDDDDPWNQTAADNAEWLQRFKRKVGILPAESGPQLSDSRSWNIGQGGSGFAPPYAFPRAAMRPYEESSGADGSGSGGVELLTVVSGGEGDATRQGQGQSAAAAVASAAAPPQPPLPQTVVVRPLASVGAATANKFLQSFTTRWDAPAAVFCSRELERGLVALVESEMRAGRPFPADEALRARAREIVAGMTGTGTTTGTGTGTGPAATGMATTTAADDEELLAKFKEMMRGRIASGAAAVGPQLQSQPQQQQQQSIPELSGVSVDDVDLTMTDGELDEILQDMNFEFTAEDLAGLGGVDGAAAMS